ncbi:hypothetical protein DMI65_21210 [Escherichia coli]|nr:hypothetical protein [Escherichia coli]
MVMCAGIACAIAEEKRTTGTLISARCTK